MSCREYSILNKSSLLSKTHWKYIQFSKKCSVVRPKTMYRLKSPWPNAQVRLDLLKSEYAKLVHDLQRPLWNLHYNVLISMWDIVLIVVLLLLYTKVMLEGQFRVIKVISLGHWQSHDILPQCESTKWIRHYLLID